MKHLHPSTNRPHRRPHRWALTMVAFSALLLLAACGPGVGGTGTGQEHGAVDFGALATPVCTSNLADSLNCPPEVNGMRPPVGSLPLLLADATPPRRATGRIDGSRLELSLYCEGWSFYGEWGVAMREPDGRFYGTGRGPGGRVQPAVLVLQKRDGGGFQALLQDANGQALVPPVQLQAVSSLGVVQACTL
jgi:hypothetical protein